jgi:type IV secretory pathway TrbD component
MLIVSSCFPSTQREFSAARRDLVMSRHLMMRFSCFELVWRTGLLTLQVHFQTTNGLALFVSVIAFFRICVWAVDVFFASAIGDPNVRSVYIMNRYCSGHEIRHQASSSLNHSKGMKIQ